MKIVRIQKVRELKFIIIDFNFNKILENGRSGLQENRKLPI